MRSNSALAHNIKEKTSQTLEVVRDKVVDTSKEAGRRVHADAHRRPWFYVGIAAFFTAFFSFVLGRKSKR